MSAALLNRFGPQHRFTSQLVSTGQVDNGVLRGDLVFEGGGDPGLTTEDLWRLVQRLQLAGVTHVDGALVVSQWRFAQWSASPLIAATRVPESPTPIVRR